MRRVVRCECWQGEHTRRLFDEARIPPRYRRCDFDNFQVYPNEKLTNAVSGGAPVRRRVSRQSPRGSASSVRTASARRTSPSRRSGPRSAAGCEGIFYEVSDLLRLIRSTYNPVTKTAEMEILQPLVSVQLLVLDDVGKEKTSEWVEETMTFIVNSRYNHRLTTIFTSNYEDNPDIEALDSLRVRVGSRMYSRMHEMCDFIEYGGADYRLLPPNGGVDDLIALWKVTGEQRSRLPSRAKGQVRAQLKHPGRAELGWSGGKAGS